MRDTSRLANFERYVVDMWFTSVTLMETCNTWITDADILQFAKAGLQCVQDSGHKWQLLVVGTLAFPTSPKTLLSYLF